MDRPMGGDPGEMRETCPLQYLGRGTTYRLSPPNNLPQNDQVLVFNFNFAFQIRPRRHFCTYNG